MTPTLPVPVARQIAKLVSRYIVHVSIPWERQRSRMDRAFSAVKLPKSIAMTSEDIASVRVEVIRPIDGRNNGAVLHVHGGGFTVGSPSNIRIWAAALSERLGVTVYLPDYALAPEHPFPAGLDQVTAVIDHVMNEVGAASFALSGDSAGANLALSAALRRVNAHKTLPACLLLVSPWLDLTNDRLDDPKLIKRDPMLSPEWLAACATAYAPGDLENPEVSPLLGSLDGLPPVLVQGGSDDILVPDANEFVAALEGKSPVTYNVGVGLWHDFVMQVGMLAAADEALVNTAEFLIEHCEFSRA